MSPFTGRNVPVYRKDRRFMSPFTGCNVPIYGMAEEAIVPIYRTVPVYRIIGAGLGPISKIPDYGITI